MLHFSSRNQWVGIFLAFQSQCFHTDDQTGHAIPEACETPPEEAVKIIAALVNPAGHDEGLESVTLINLSPTPMALDGWSLADKNKRKHNLSGTLASGQTRVVSLTGADIQLSNKGGMITLLNNKGIKMHGVSYTKDQVKKQGWTTLF